MGQKVNYNKNKTNKLKTIGVVILFLFVAVILLISIKKTIASFKGQKEIVEPGANYTTIKEYTSLESLLASYSCKVFSKTQNGNYTEVKLSFGESLYNGETSNERYFTNVCKGVAEYLNFRDFRLIDESKKIDIEVKCEKPNITEIKINGDVNYYLNKDSEINSRKRNNVITEFTIQSQELKDLNNNNWNEKNVNLGTKESSCDGYNIYFDEGIRARTVARDIYNVIFTSKYKGQIAGGLNANSSKDAVEKALGNPTFKNGEEIYGYMGSQNYLFFDFINKEVSVYPVIEITKEDEEQLKSYIEEMNKTNDVKRFVTDLTDLWLDFDTYNYDSDFVDLRYTLKGVQISISGSSLKNGIFIYSNYVGDINIQDIDNVYVAGSDFVFEDEKERVSHESMQRVEQGDFTDEQLKDLGIDFSVRFKDVNENGYIGPRFYSRDKSYPDSELDKTEEVSSYRWYGTEDQNYLFIYTIDGEGIYVYNCQTRVSAEILKLTGEIKLESAKDGIISFTNNGENKEINVILN